MLCAQVQSLQLLGYVVKNAPTDCSLARQRATCWDLAWGWAGGADGSGLHLASLTPSTIVTMQAEGADPFQCLVSPPYLTSEHPVNTSRAGKLQTSAKEPSSFLWLVGFHWWSY